MNWRRVGPYAIQSESGEWQIAKYASNPTYCLFDVSDKRNALFVDSDNDVEKLKRKVDDKTPSTL